MIINIQLSIHVVLPVSITENVSIDGDNPLHVKWIFEKSLERANDFHITGITYRLTQGQSIVNSVFVAGSCGIVLILTQYFLLSFIVN